MVKKVLKGLGKISMAVGGTSETVFTGIGNSVIGLGKAAGKAGAKVGKAGSQVLTKELTEEALENATLYERMIGKKLNVAGTTLAIGATMGVSTVGAVVNNGGGKIAKLGYTSVGENLDRLVSYDGSGFMNNVNKVAGGDPEVMQDIVNNTFNQVNHFGASGDIVFALHNMREG